MSNPLITKIINELEQRFEEYKHEECLLLQLPAGLQIYGLELIDYLKSKGLKAYLYLDEAFGACDLPIYEAKQLGCSAILHLAHTEFLKGREIQGVNIYYVPVFIDYDVKKTAKIITETLKDKKDFPISLHTHLQYVHKLKDLAKELEEKGFKVLLKKSPLESYDGQILGCEVASAALAYKEGAKIAIYVGDGYFHPYALIKDAPKDMDIIMVNPLNGEVKIYSHNEREKLLKSYYLKYMKIKDAKRLGFLMTSKVGQHERFGKFFKKVIEKFESKGKQVYVLVGNTIKPEWVNIHKLDAIINFACPRIEDDKTYDVPVLSYTTYKKIEFELERD